MAQRNSDIPEIKPFYVVCFFGVALFCLMLYESGFFSVYQGADAPWADNQNEMVIELTHLRENQPYWGQLNFVGGVQPQCTPMRVSGAHLPAGLTMTKGGAFHGTPVQSGFFTFYYRCSVDGVDSFGSVPIYVFKES